MRYPVNKDTKSCSVISSGYNNNTYISRQIISWLKSLLLSQNYILLWVPMANYVQNTNLFRAPGFYQSASAQNTEGLGEFTRSQFAEWAICLKPISGKANLPNDWFIKFTYTFQPFSCGSWVLILSSLVHFKECLMYFFYGPHCSRWN